MATDSAIHLMLALMATAALAPAVMSIKRPGLLLSGPVILGGFFFYLYVFLPYSLLPYRNSFFDQKMFPFGLFVALVSLLAFYAGWGLTGPRAGRSVERPAYYSAKRLYLLGLVLTVIAVVGEACYIKLVGGWHFYFSKPHGLAARDVYVTAYVFDLWRFIYPGILLMLQSVVSVRGHAWLRGKSLLIIIVSALLLVESILKSSRQDVFFLFAIWIFVTYLARPKIPSRVVLGALLLTAGCLPLLLAAYRSRLYIGTHWTEFSSTNDLLGKIQSVHTGNEFLIHSALVSSCYDRGEYDYGQSLLGVLVNFIPRFAWAEKPYGTFRLDPIKLIYQHWHWTPAYGSAVTGVASTFFEWGFFALFFWFVLGRIAGELFNKARLGNPAAIGTYTALVCVLFVFSAQDIWAGLKNAIFFFGPLYLAYKFARVQIATSLVHRSRGTQGQAKGVNPWRDRAQPGTLRQPIGSS